MLGHRYHLGKIISQYDLSSNLLFRLIAEKSWSARVQIMNGHAFERCLVEIMAEMAEKKGLKHKPLAIAAWPDRKDPGTKWRKIRNGTDPRGFQVQDAYDLALAMGISFLELCGMAQGLLLQTTNQQVQKTVSPEEQKSKTIDIPGQTKHAHAARIGENAG